MPSLAQSSAYPPPSRARRPRVTPWPRTLLTPTLWLLACLLIPAWLTGCGDGNTPPPPPTEGSATVGAAGGFVTGPDGVKLGIPDGSVETDTTFRIARDGSGAPPLPAGIDLASEVYAVTPHGNVFGASASVELPVSSALAAGRPTFLMKADPGGRWSVVSTGLAGASTLRAGIDSLSYLAVGACQNNLPAGSPFGQACPTSNRLSLELLINGTSPVPISQDTTYGAPIPVLLVTTPETLTFRMTWTRPTGTNRIDSLDTGTAYAGTSSLSRQAGFTFSTTAPRFLSANDNSFSRIFTVDVDPARVSGASGPNGVVRRIWAQASYNVTSPGNVGSADWDFTAWVPIQVRSVATVVLPVIATQPANASVSDGQPAGFSVTASVTPAAALTYQWSRSASPSSPFTAIPGATAASFNIASAQLSDDGAQFQVQVCAGTRCVTSNAATLSVVAVSSGPIFTTSPLDQRVVAGQTVSLNAVATGAPMPAIRWQRAPAGTSNFADITGVPTCAPTNPSPGAPSVAGSCTVGPLNVGDSGQRYRAMATSTAAPGGVTSSIATVTVDAAAMAPVITSQPAPQSTTVGGSATFRVAATGTAMLSYAWRLGSGNMPSVSGQFAFTAPSGDCRGNITYSDGGATATFSDLNAACDGLLAVVTVSNNVNPPAVSIGALLTVNQAVATGACFGGQSSWCYANPSPQAGGLLGLAYDPSTSSFTAVGPSGTTLRTADGGATWQLAFETGRTYFTDVVSPAPGLLVAAGLPPLGSGQNAGVFSSTDGGRNWTRRLDAGFPGQFAVTKLAFANASVGVAAGFRGLWRTTNGGVTWTAVPNAPDADFVVSVLGGVTWVDANVVLIHGSGGKILRSADQGVSWTDVSPAGFFEDWLDMAFNAAGVGIAVGPSGRVARSTNGGASWQELVTPLSEPGTAVAFADANTAVVMGNIGQTMRSTDAGATWTTGFAFGASAFYRLRFSSPTFGLAVSGANGLTLRTTDGGETWTRIGGGTIDENVVGMAASPSGNVVLAGSLARALLRSVDGGATWRRSGSFPVGAQFQKPSFATEQRAIAIRPEGQIVLSVDAGQTWSIADDRLGQVWLNDATMASATVGLVVGNTGLILRSTDGGSTWAPVASGTSQQLRAVRCLTATVCVAVGGDLLRSTDGGATWAVLPSPGNGFGANAIARLSDSVAVASAGDLWRTADAGLTWTRVYTAVQGTQLGVAFSTTGIGIATGYDGILRSTDQGLTWTAQSVPAPSYLSAVVWVSATTVLVGGDGGAILRNLQAGVP